MEGVDRILIPGEPEAIVETERRRLGIFLEDQTWDEIKQIAHEFNVPVPGL